MKLSEANLTLGDLDLGGFDAESDSRLAEYFVTTPYVTTAVDGKRTLFLGRKGSGKSALFDQLPRLVNKAVVVQLTPDQYAWSALRDYSELGLMREAAHTNAWKLTLAIEIAATLIESGTEWGPEAEAAHDQLKSFLRQNFGDAVPGLTGTARSILKGLGSLNLSAFGFGVGVDRADGDSAPLTPAVLEAILESLTPMLAEAPVLVGIDRLDDSWDGSDDAQSLLVGLLKGAKDLNDRFRTPPGEQDALRILVFLRSDIYSGLEFDDKDKHRATEQLISWNQDELYEMLSRRLPTGVSPDDLFEDSEMRGRISPFTYVAKRTFLRPREILQFTDVCIRKAGDQASEVPKHAIRDAEDQYSSWKVDDLKQEYRRVFPQFENLLEALRQEIHRYDKVEDIIELLQSKSTAEFDELGGRRCLEILFDASVIGIRLGGTGSTRFKAEEPELALPSAGTVYVHQSLYRGLNIREARKSDSPNEQDDAIDEG